MSIEIIENMWSEDCVIDKTDLSQATRHSVEIHAKYLKYYNAANRRLRELEAEKARLTLLKNDYYLGNLDAQTLKENNWSPQKRLILKSDLEMYLNADREIINLNLKIGEMQQTVKFLDSIIRAINNRAFHIKNIIEYEKFINGSN